MEYLEESVLKSKILNPNYIRQRSYYGKAKEIQYGDFKYLKSYETVVCAIAPNGEFTRFWNGYSVTTMNHINEFRKKNGLNGLSKKEWKEIEVTDESYVPSEVKNVEMNYTTSYPVR